jgi:lipopolysaccharide biosynthesis glycosyltransferase
LIPDPILVAIGYDKREAVAYHVCVQSIIEHASEPHRLRFMPVAGEQRDGSNAFIYQRFLVPWLCSYVGRALFLDGDMIVKGDVCKLVDNSRLDKAVSVVKHDDYKTKYPIKYLGNKNEDYPRKNWSSVIVWNCGNYKNRKLTPEFVAQSDGSYLHRFQWLKDDDIDSLPTSWNRLVLEQDIKPDDKLLHYTIGTPCFIEYAVCDGADEWWNTYRRAVAPI